METFSLSLKNNGNYINYQMIFNRLVIDDHKLERNNTINLLKNVLSFLKINDHAILERSDGIDLLNLIRLDKEKKIEYIFIDENMDYLNGSESVHIIRKWEEYHKIKRYKIISITAFDDKDTSTRLKSSGVNSILLKPCNKSDFIKIFQKFSKSS